MGLFGKKKNADKIDIPQMTPQSSNAPRPVANKKKNTDTMASVLHETVFENVLDDFKANADFITQRDGDTVYTGICLSVADIGGLSRKTNKDEAKGSIIECINSGRIKCLITPGLMKDEKIVIIPDAITCAAMDEFSLLTQAPYVIAFVREDGRVEVTPYKITFDEINNAVGKGIPVDTLLVEKGIVKAEPEPEPVEETPDEYEDISSSEKYIPHEDIENAEPIEEVDDGTIDEELDALPFTPDEDESDYMSDTPEEYFPKDEDTADGEEMPEDETGISDMAEADDEDGSYEDAADEEPETEVTEEQLNEAIVRRFYSDDLGLEVTTEPFDTQFLHAETYVPFDVDRSEGDWLYKHLNELCKTANVDMERRHKVNLAKMRERYISLVSMCFTDLQRELDTSDANTQFGRLARKLRENKDSQDEILRQKAAEKRQELIDKWAAKLDEVGANAAEDAKAKYIERFGRQHDAELDNVEPVILDKLEDDYREALRNMNNMRREEAAKRFDCAVTETLKEVSQMYSQCLDEEHSVYEKYRDEIRQYIEDNRQHDIDHDKRILDELEHSTKVENLTAEYQKKAEAMTSDFEAKRVSLRAEIDAMHTNTENLIRKKEDDCASRIQRMQDELTSKQREVDSLVAQITELDTRKEKEWKSRVIELRNERDSLEDKCKHIESAHKRSNIILVVLMVVIVIACLAVGAIGGIGYAFNHNDTSAQQSSIVQQYDDNSETTRAEQTQSSATK